MDIPRTVFISHPQGKMKGIPAITTSSFLNQFCDARAQKEGSVCSKCYAAKGLKVYAEARDRYAQNTELLSSHLLSDLEIPIVNSHIFRFETHGDLINVVHAKNYIKISAANPHCTFALWTKNSGFLNQAIRELGKPDNLICIFSSYLINQVDKTYQRYDWVDKVFTVYDKTYIAQNNIEINCGAKSCLSCRKCYTKSDTDKFINEKLK